MTKLHMRPPRKEDAAEIKSMLKPYIPYVGTNPVYTYLLICEHFSQTSTVVANEADEIVAFTSGFQPPEKPGTLFIWEVAVKKGYHGNNLYIRMIRELCHRITPNYLEATVNPSNKSSQKRLKQIAEMFDCEITSDTVFPSDYFCDDKHEDEVLYRLGPIKKITERLANSE